MKRRILKRCVRDLAQNFIRTSGEPGFKRLRNSVSAGSEQNFISTGRARNFNFINDFSFINAARNFTLALVAACVFSGCDGGSDAQNREQSARSEQNFSAGNKGQNFNKSADNLGRNSAQNSIQGSVQNSMPQGFESKQNSDLNSTIDELANDAKVLGEALQNLQKKAPEVLNDFAARNAGRTKDLLKQGEAAAREAGKNLDQMGQSLQGIIKDANESLGKVLEGFGVAPQQKPRGRRSQERDEHPQPDDGSGRQSFRI